MRWRSGSDVALRHTSAESLNLGMDTVMTHRAFGRHAAEALHAVGQEAERLEGMLSRFMPESDIAVINKSAGLACCSVGPETCSVLSCAVELSAACQGIFDVTIGPLVDLWGIGHGALRPLPGRDPPGTSWYIMVIAAGPGPADAGLVGQDNLSISGASARLRRRQVHQLFKNTACRRPSRTWGQCGDAGRAARQVAWRVGIQHPGSHVP